MIYINKRLYQVQHNMTAKSRQVLPPAIVLLLSRMIQKPQLAKGYLLEHYLNPLSQSINKNQMEK